MFTDMLPGLTGSENNSKSCALARTALWCYCRRSCFQRNSPTSHLEMFFTQTMKKRSQHTGTIHCEIQNSKDFFFLSFNVILKDNS